MTNTKTLPSDLPLLPTTYVLSVCVPVLCFMHTGSAFILKGSFFGATPSSETVPVTAPAVDASTAA